jgi:beta-phosphoglucomutase-like phosphatase (HAD superfamily)/dTDP-glucose pyrophosphorylase
MIKLVIFDLDGVLIDTRTLHFEVLNQALLEEGEQYVISYQDHLLKFDGLSTSTKLYILEKERGLSVNAKERVWHRKQELTIPKLRETIEQDEKIRRIVSKLKFDGIKVYVASNSIRESVRVCIESLGLTYLIDGYLSNDDVDNHKPHPEMYWKVMSGKRVLPSETLIVEDSYIGRSAAVASGANLCPVNNKDEVTMERIYQFINKDTKPMKWQDDKMNVLIPCAGYGSRFKDAGYAFPKPLIEVNGEPMLKVVVDNLNIEANFIYIVRKEHYDTYNLKSLLNILTPKCKIITVDEVTEGAACTTLLAEHLIDNDNPLLIANSDQFMDWKSGEFYHSVNSDNVDASILIFENVHPKWSYVKTNEYGNVTEVAEKKVISDKATCGVYYYKKGSDYVRYAKQMIEKDIRHNGEFYVAPVFSEFILDGKIIKTFTVDKMHGLGDPESLNSYLSNNK